MNTKIKRRQLGYLPTTGWSVISSTNEAGPGEPDPAHPELILDNDPSTLWAPENEMTKVRTHELTIDMQSLQTVNGFKITQALKNATALDYYPDMLHIQMSKDNYEWEDAFLHLQATIGRNWGESTVLRIPVPRQARYIKIKLTDKLAARNNTCLAGFMVF